MEEISTSTSSESEDQLEGYLLDQDTKSAMNSQEAIFRHTDVPQFGVGFSTPKDNLKLTPHEPSTCRMKSIDFCNNFVDTPQSNDCVETYDVSINTQHELSVTDIERKVKVSRSSSRLAGEIKGQDITLEHSENSSVVEYINQSIEINTSKDCTGDRIQELGCGISSDKNGNLQVDVEIVGGAEKYKEEDSQVKEKLSEEKENTPASQDIEINKKDVHVKHRDQVYNLRKRRAKSRNYLKVDKKTSKAIKLSPDELEMIRQKIDQEIEKLEKKRNMYATCLTSLHHGKDDLVDNVTAQIVLIDEALDVAMVFKEKCHALSGIKAFSVLEMLINKHSTLHKVNIFPASGIDMNSDDLSSRESDWPPWVPFVTLFILLVLIGYMFVFM